MGLQNGKTIKAEERRSEVIRLKIAGYSEIQISHMVGVSNVQVHRDVKKRLSEVRRDDKEAVDQEWGLQNARYERLLRKWWPIALGEDETRNPEETDSDSSIEDYESRQIQATRLVLDILRQISIIGGIIPDKPLIVVNQDNRQVNVYGEDAHTVLLSRIAGVIDRGGEDGNNQGVIPGPG